MENPCDFPKMPKYKKVYESQAEEYEALVSREDYQSNLLPALNELFPIADKDIVEFGAGTGRISRLVAPKAKFIYAFDAYPRMIEEGQKRLLELGLHNVVFSIAENKRLPIADAFADITLAGWTFGHSISWYPNSWKDEISKCVKEMDRITKKRGIAIIIETLGTGYEIPKEPNENLATYYSMLEKDFGFSRTWIRTDYLFESKNQADQLTETFFGKTFTLQISSDGSAILPECTGIWYRKNN